MALGFWVNIGTLMIRIGFWGPSYYNYNKDSQNNIGNYLGPYSRIGGLGLGFWVRSGCRVSFVFGVKV